MPSDDYASTIGGGLKLKGSKPSGVTKTKSKKKREKRDAGGDDTDRSVALSTSATREAPARRNHDGVRDVDKSSDVIGDDVMEKELARREGEAYGRESETTAQIDIEDKDDGRDSGKTPTERRHEEMRRKRLNERLQKDGSSLAKTHKQRVEELNRYLSTLSEHHDMPRIGPG